MESDQTAVSTFNDILAGPPVAESETPVPGPQSAQAADSSSAVIGPSLPGRAAHEARPATAVAFPPLAAPHDEPFEVVAFPEPAVIGVAGRLTSAPRGGIPRERFKVADTVLDGADLPGLVIRGASLRGDMHRYEGTTRQDAMGVYHVSDGGTEAYLACVADGVGSAPFSQFGSAQVCELAKAELEADGRLTALLSPQSASDLRDHCERIVTALAAQLAVKADNAGLARGAVSTTLAAAVVEANPARPADRRYAAFAVGDSPAFLIRGGQFNPLFRDQHQGEITGTETSALPTAIRHGQALTASGSLLPGEVLLICTDGLSNPMRGDETKKHLLTSWTEREPPSVLEFGGQLSFRAKSHDDDRTAVCFWNVGEK